MPRLPVPSPTVSLSAVSKPLAKIELSATASFWFAMCRSCEVIGVAPTRKIAAPGGLPGLLVSPRHQSFGCGIRHGQKPEYVDVCSSATAKAGYSPIWLKKYRQLPREATFSRKAIGWSEFAVGRASQPRRKLARGWPFAPLVGRRAGPPAPLSVVIKVGKFIHPIALRSAASL